MALFQASEQIDLHHLPLEAWSAFRTSIERMGNVTLENQDRLRLRGSTKYGLQKVLIKVNVEYVSSGSRVTIHAFSDDIWAAGAKDGIKRLLETFEYRDNPDYQPAKNGVVQVSGLAIAICCIVVVILNIVRFLPGELKYWIIGFIFVWGVMVIASVLIERWRFLRDE
jgi:hypothetical protein